MLRQSFYPSSYKRKASSVAQRDLYYHHNAPVIEKNKISSLALSCRKSAKSQWNGCSAKQNCHTFTTIPDDIIEFEDSLRPSSHSMFTKVKKQQMYQKQKCKNNNFLLLPNRKELVEWKNMKRTAIFQSNISCKSRSRLDHEQRQWSFRPLKSKPRKLNTAGCLKVPKEVENVLIGWDCEVVDDPFME